MQNMVKQIVEMDKKARQITDAAQKEKVNSEKEVAKRREEIHSEYLERARRRIALNEPKEREAAEKKWVTIEAHNQELSKQMDELYAQMGDKWVKSIVQRVIGE